MMLAVAALFFQITLFAQVLPAEPVATAPATPSAVTTSATPRILAANTDAPSNSNLTLPAAPVHVAPGTLSEPLRASSLSAQPESSLASIGVPEPPAWKPVRFVSVEGAPSRKK